MTKLVSWTPVVGLCLALLLVPACGGGGGGGETGTANSTTGLVVRWITPTNKQEVNPDLSDPELNGMLTVDFSSGLNPNDVLDPTNAYNGLTSDVNILDSAFQRVRGTPQIGGDIGNVLYFWPQGGTLANGQYTITVSRDVRGLNGRQLNSGLFDFRSSFTVGADIYKPKIRNTYPAPNQKDVDKFSDINITFNESLNPATVTLSTITVMNGSVNPPVAVNGTIKTARDDFEIVFTPDPANPMPPNATIVVTVYGGANGVADALGNTFDDPGIRSPNYVFQFDTVKEPPPPNNPPPVIIPPPYGDALIFVATGNSIISVAERPYFANTADLTLWGTGNPVPNSTRFIGQPEEMIFDPRLDAATLHTWLYVIDRASRSVTIVRTRDSRIVWRWKDLPDPRGLAIAPNGLTLYVTNYSSDSVSFIDIGSVTPGAAAPTTTVKNLTKLRNPSDPSQGGSRSDIQVGRGPIGAAHAPDAYLVFIANNVENSCSIINPQTATVITTFPIGTAPQDAAATFNFPGIGRFAFITCLGGGTDNNGSVSLWWSRPNGLQADITGFKNPKGCIYDWGANCWVANSGGNTAARLTLAIAGAGFAATILPTISADITVGKNPSGVTLEPISMYMGAPSRCVITADRGSSQISFIDASQPSRPIFSLSIPGAQDVCSFIDQ